MAIKLGLPFTIAIGLFAQGGQTLEGWGQLTALGIVAVVLIFIVTKLLPQAADRFVKQTELHVDAQKAQQAEFVRVIDAIHARAHDDYQALAAAISQLQVHCAANIGKTNE